MCTEILIFTVEFIDWLTEMTLFEMTVLLSKYWKSNLGATVKVSVINCKTVNSWKSSLVLLCSLLSSINKNDKWRHELHINRTLKSLQCGNSVQIIYFEIPAAAMGNKINNLCFLQKTHNRVQFFPIYWSFHECLEY